MPQRLLSRAVADPARPSQSRRAAEALGLLPQMALSHTFDEPEIALGGSLEKSESSLVFVTLVCRDSRRERFELYDDQPLGQTRFIPLRGGGSGEKAPAVCLDSGARQLGVLL